MSIFYRVNMTSFLNYVTATLRALFAWRGSYIKHQFFQFSTLYTTTPHDKLKSRLASTRNSFISKNGNRRYKYLVLDHEESYFVKEHSDSKSKFSEDNIINVLEILVDNIFVIFAGKVFKQIVGIPMERNCAPLLADIFLCSYEAEFIQSLLSTGRKQLASLLNFKSDTWIMFCP